MKLGKAAVVYGLLEVILGREYLRRRVSALIGGALLFWVGAWLILWGIVVLFGWLFVELAGFTWLRRPALLTAAIMLLLGVLVVWQGLTQMRTRKR